MPNLCAREIFLSASDVAPASSAAEDVEAVIVAVASTETETDSGPAVLMAVVAAFAVVVPIVIVADGAEVVAVVVIVSFDAGTSDVVSMGSFSVLIILARGTELTGGTVTSTGSPKLNSSSSSAAFN